MRLTRKTKDVITRIITDGVDAYLSERDRTLCEACTRRWVKVISQCMANRIVACVK
jgi:hypothetical protein